MCESHVLVLKPLLRVLHQSYHRCRSCHTPMTPILNFICPAGSMPLCQSIDLLHCPQPSAVLWLCFLLLIACFIIIVIIIILLLLSLLLLFLLPLLLFLLLLLLHTRQHRCC